MSSTAGPKQPAGPKQQEMINPKPKLPRTAKKPATHVNLTDSQLLADGRNTQFCHSLHQLIARFKTKSEEINQPAAEFLIILQESNLN